MKKFMISALAASMMAAGGIANSVHANDFDMDAFNVEEFAEEFRQYHYNMYPDVDPADMNLGVYALNEDARAQYEQQMFFPPQDDYIEEGAEIWAEYRFSDGQPLSACLGEPEGLRAKYPFYDEELGEVRVLEHDIVRCEKAHNDNDDDMLNNTERAMVMAYLASESRGELINVQVDSDGAKEAFVSGMSNYFRKTGQLDNSCADCHTYHGGDFIRAEHLHLGVGNTAHFPTHRISGGGRIVTLQQRISGCIRDTGVIQPPRNTEEARDLEFFLSYIDNGQEINGPGLRK